MASLESVRAAKEEFKRKFPGVHVGISGNEKDGFSLAVRVGTQETADKMPKEIDGVPIRCQMIGKIAKQS